MDVFFAIFNKFIDVKLLPMMLPMKVLLERNAQRLR